MSCPEECPVCGASVAWVTTRGPGERYASPCGCRLPPEPRTDGGRPRATASVEPPASAPAPAQPQASARVESPARGQSTAGLPVGARRPPAMLARASADASPARTEGDR